jgi:hypothetical protein
VGISAVPILDTTLFISGKELMSVVSASVEASILAVKELPAGIIICKAKSPSSSVGINSAPSLVNSQMLAASARNAVPKVFHA